MLKTTGTLALIRLHKKADLLETKVKCMKDRKICAGLIWVKMDAIDPYTAKKAMENERFGNCLTNARQKIRYVFGQNFTDLVYMYRRHSLLTTFVPGSI